MISRLVSPERAVALVWVEPVVCTGNGIGLGGAYAIGNWKSLQAIMEGCML